MNMRLILIVTASLILLAAGFTPDVSGSARGPGMAAPANGYDLVNAVNSLRAANGLPPYNINSILMTIAQNQADYLASTGGVYGHIGAGGTRPYQRALAAGYSVAGDLSMGGLFSENWAASSSVQSAVNSWMGDATHRETMLSSDLADIGGGIASGGGMNYYVIDAGLSTGSKAPSSSSTGGGTAVVIVSGTPVSQEPTIAMVIVNTPDQSGIIYYTVLPGQTLSQIAMAYKTTVNQIKLYNNLTSDTIYAGQKLFIAKAGTLTPTLPSATATRDLSTFTPLPTLIVQTDTPTATETPIPAAPVSAPAGAGGAVAAIILVALVAAALVAWAGRSRPV
jgi:uncharacterized protein YkwD